MTGGGNPCVSLKKTDIQEKPSKRRGLEGAFGRACNMIEERKKEMVEGE